MQKKLLVWGMALLLLTGMPQASWATSTEVDALIEKLVDKKILSKEEAIEIKGEIAADAKLIKEESLKQNLPSWVQDLKLKGDFRLRHEWSKRNDSSDQDRSRGRIRYRLGLETKINDHVKVGAGLASNGGSPRSTNQTFTDTFAKAGINLDYAYAQYDPNESISLIGGKMKIPFWEPADLLWDTDITPEGGALNLKHNINDQAKIFSNFGFFVLDESAADQTDPFMYVLQPGVELKSGEKADFKTAFTYYGFSGGANKSVLDNRSSPTTNTVSGGQYMYKYNSYAAGAELGINNPLSLLGEDISSFVPRLGIIGEYIINPAADDENTGWLAGMYFGDKKVAGPKQWQAKATYRKLGRDAWLDVFPDSDFYGGATDVKGYEGILEIGLHKNVILSLDYYRTERLSSTVAKQPESVLQTDLNFKF